MKPDNSISLPILDVEGELPDAGVNDLVLFFACDDVAFRLQGIISAFSLNRNAPGSVVHFQVINPAPDFDHLHAILIVALQNLKFTLTYEQRDLPKNDSHRQDVLSSLGPQRLAEIFLHVPARYLLLPQGALVCGPASRITTVLSDLLTSIDVGLVKSRRQILLYPTSGTRQFGIRLGQKILEMDKADLIHANTVPFAVNEIISGMDDTGDPLNVRELPLAILDSDCHKESVIWTNNGETIIDDSAFGHLHQSLWSDTLLDNIRQNFWGDMMAPNCPRVLVLTPRLDTMFKRGDLVTAEIRDAYRGGEIEALRRHWRLFSRHIAEAIERCGANAQVLSIDKWRMSANLVNAMTPDLVIV